MRNCKKRPRPPTRSQGRPSRDLFYQTLTDYSDEETQGILEFMKKLKQADDETCIFNRFCCGIDSYRYGCINYISLKNRLLWILRDHKGLLEEFHQLKVLEENRIVYKAFISAVAFSGDMEILVEQLDEILRDHTPLKEEFETFLVESRLLKHKREESVEDTPSYQIRPEAEVRSSSDGVFNEKYYLVSPYDPEVASQNEHQRCLNKKRNNLEDKLMKEDMLMGDLDAVIRFGKDPKLFEKPPLGFNRVLDWFCGGKEITLEEMARAKTIRAISVYNRTSRRVSCITFQNCE
ncbi:hypothetical protein Bca101_072353 [Brassica carinata]